MNTDMESQAASVFQACVRSASAKQSDKAPALQSPFYPLCGLSLTEIVWRPCPYSNSQLAVIISNGVLLINSPA